jgi:hypothetical protein
MRLLFIDESVWIEDTLGRPLDNTIQRGPRSSSFWLPRNLSNHMDRQARIRDTVLVKSREITGKSQKKPCRSGWGRRGKDDIKQNTLAPLNLNIPLRIRCCI